MGSMGSVGAYGGFEESVQFAGEDGEVGGFEYGGGGRGGRGSLVGSKFAVGLNSILGGDGWAFGRERDVRGYLVGLLIWSGAT